MSTLPVDGILALWRGLEGTGNELAGIYARMVDGAGIDDRTAVVVRLISGLRRTHREAGDLLHLTLKQLWKTPPPKEGPDPLLFLSRPAGPPLRPDLVFDDEVETAAAGDHPPLESRQLGDRP